MNFLLRSFGLVIFGSLSFMALSTKVYAHSTLENTITINGNYIIELETPPPSKLPWVEHTNRTELRAGEPIIFKIDITKTPEIFDSTDLSYVWEFQGMPSIAGDIAEVSFPKPGAYNLVLHVYSANKEIASEDILVQVGGVPEAAAITLNAQSESRNVTNRRIDINRNQSYTFSITNPDTTKYSYIWDLGEEDIVTGIEVTKQFANTLLPNYVVLRTTDVANSTYADSFVRIESELDYENGVPMPPFNVDTARDDQSNSVNPIVLILGGLLFILASSAAILIYHERKESH